MNTAAKAQKVLPEISEDKESLRYGAQLAVAVLIAYLIPWLLHLPEGFWAVTTALIVMRSHTGALRIACGYAGQSAMGQDQGSVTVSSGGSRRRKG